MKRMLVYLLALGLALSFWGCAPAEPPAEESTGTMPTETEAGPTSAWQIIDGEKYWVTEDGRIVTGWFSDPAESGSVRYYLDDSGKALTGWQDIEGKRYHFGQDGTMTTGWLEEGGSKYYFGIDGAMVTGLLNIQNNGYYFGEDGTCYSGWLEQDGKTYHFDDSGVMAVGPREIDGEQHYFSPHGVKILLVNPWNSLPEGYQVELEHVDNWYRLEKNCAQALKRMVADCTAAGFEPKIASAYRTQEDQEFLYWRKVGRLEAAGMDRELALVEAAKVVAIPGTSEHQLGLAVDLSDKYYTELDELQAETDTQKWLMEHCYEYGFILRYPTGTTEITGIIYEPWHYRYVGQEIAQELRNLGITLEEYLGAA